MRSGSFKSVCAPSSVRLDSRIKVAMSGQISPCYYLGAALSLAWRLLARPSSDAGHQLSEIVPFSMARLLRGRGAFSARRPDRRSAGVGEPRAEEGKSPQAGLCVGRPGVPAAVPCPRSAARLSRLLLPLRQERRPADERRARLADCDR